MRCASNDGARLGRSSPSRPRLRGTRPTPRGPSSCRPRRPADSRSLRERQVEAETSSTARPVRGPWRTSLARRAARSATSAGLAGGVLVQRERAVEARARDVRGRRRRRGDAGTRRARRPRTPRAGGSPRARRGATRRCAGTTARPSPCPSAPRGTPRPLPCSGRPNRGGRPSRAIRRASGHCRRGRGARPVVEDPLELRHGGAAHVPQDDLLGRGVDDVERRATPGPGTSRGRRRSRASRC